MRLSDIVNTQKRIEAGDWVDIPQLPGVRLKSRGIGNRDWRALREKLANPEPQVSTTRPPDETEDERSQRQQVELITRTLLVDWEGLSDESGSDIVFSRERAVELLSDPEMAILRDASLYAASRVATVTETIEQRKAAKKA